MSISQAFRVAGWHWWMEPKSSLIQKRPTRGMAHWWPGDSYFNSVPMQTHEFQSTIKSMEIGSGLGGETHFPSQECGNKSTFRSGAVVTAAVQEGHHNKADSTLGRKNSRGPWMDVRELPMTWKRKIIQGLNEAVERASLWVWLSREQHAK